MNLSPFYISGKLESRWIFSGMYDGSIDGGIQILHPSSANILYSMREKGDYNGIVSPRYAR